MFNVNYLVGKLMATQLDIYSSLLIVLLVYSDTYYTSLFILSR